jgi:CRP-like cAMP-binding protein
MNGTLTIGPMERAVQLRALPLFDAMRTAQVVGLAQLAEERQLFAGGVLQERGRTVRALAVLLDGVVRVEREGAAPVQIEAPHPIGVLELLADQPSPTRLIAARPVSLLAIDASRWWDVLEEEFAIVVELRAALGRALAAHQTIDVVPGAAAAEADGPVSQDTVDQLLRLHRVPLLRPFGVAVLDALVRGGQAECEYAAGASLFSAGDSAEQLLVVTHGEVSCGADGGAAQSAGPGAVLGANAALSGLAHGHDARAVVPTTAIAIDARRVWDLAEDHFHVARALLAHAARRLIALDTGPQPVVLPATDRAEESPA